MKKNAFATLIKDVILAAVAWGISAMMIQSMFAMPMSDAAMMATMCAGIPFGWRWSSKIITAVSFYGIGIKLLISLLLGMFAIFLVIGLDVLRCIGQLFGSLGAMKRQAKAG